MLLYYLYCLCKLFKDRFFLRCFSFQKADAKVRTLSDIFQIFSEVFLFFFFLVVSLCEREAKEKGKKKGSYTVFCQNVKVSLLSFSKADAKVEDLLISAKYIYPFFITFHKLFCNSLINKDVIEHVFLRMRCTVTESSHYIYTCARREIFKVLHYK